MMLMEYKGKGVPPFLPLQDTLLDGAGQAGGQQKNEQ